MNTIRSLVIIGTLCVLHISSCSAIAPVITKLTHRSLSRQKCLQAITEYSFYDHYMLEDDVPCIGWTLSALPQFIRSIRPIDIMYAFFSAAVTNNPLIEAKTVLVEGNDQARFTDSLLADYFYLPGDYFSHLHFDPRIINLSVDLDLIINLDGIFPGIYARFFAPIGGTLCNLELCEEMFISGTASYPSGYMTPGSVNRPYLLNSFSSYISGNTIGTLTGNLDGEIPPITAQGSVVFDPLKYNKILKHNQSAGGIADLRYELGWYFLAEPRYRFAINIQGSCPTSKTAQAEYLFAPQFGSNYWELGAGFIGHWIFWEDEFEELYWSLHFDANFTHMFRKREQRSFDLKCNPLSRYMLAERMTNNIQDGLTENGVTPTAQFAYEISPIANLTTQDVHVSIALQTDIVGMISFVVTDFRWDLGYNYWSRSQEKICPITDCPSPLDTQLWAIKGDARVFGFTSGGGSFTDNVAIPLSATESTANIFSGTNNSLGYIIPNSTVDNPELATAGAPAQPLLRDPNPSVGNTQIFTSIQPIVLSSQDIDYDSHSHAHSHRVFSALSYTWNEHPHIPFLTIGGFAEFGGPGSSCVQEQSCTKSINVARKQWSIFIGGGGSF